MILFPAIDLKDGQCVRLLQGDMNKATVFSNDPIAQALSFASAGFKWLHVVDLDGAVEGQSVNGEVVAEIMLLPRSKFNWVEVLENSVPSKNG